MIAEDSDKLDEFYNSHKKEDIDQKREEFYHLVNEKLSIATGRGVANTLLRTVLTKIDRFGTASIPLNHEMSGRVFITRPKLNLSSSNLVMDPLLSTLNTTSPTSISFMIRALLDTGLARGIAEGPSDREKNDFVNSVSRCPLLDIRNPFMTPLVNCFTDISGLPDLILEQHTTRTGFFSENMTYARGSEMFNKSTEISISFRDVTGGPVFALLYFWVWYMALQCKGIVMPSMWDIYRRRLNYTVSIYIFLFDSSMEVLTGWCKCTGCFPVSVPIGAKFNYSRGSEYVEAASKFTVPFVVNHVDYMSPRVLFAFNTLVKRYWQSIDKHVAAGHFAATGTEENFMGIPFIVNSERGLELRYVYDDSERIDMPIPEAGFIQSHGFKSA